MGGIMKFKAKLVVVAIFSAAALLTTGCVSSGTYQAKEQESLQLKKNLEETKSVYSELQDKSKKLAEDNDAMILKLKKLDADLVELKADNDRYKLEIDKLKAEIDKLKLENDTLKIDNEKLSTAVKPENLLKTFVELFATIQTENVKLKQALAAAEKAAQKKDAEPPIKLNPVVTKPTATIENSGDKQKETVELPRDSADASKKSAEKKIEPKNDKPKAEPAVIEDKLPGKPSLN